VGQLISSTSAHDTRCELVSYIYNVYLEIAICREGCLLDVMPNKYNNIVSFYASDRCSYFQPLMSLNLCRAHRILSITEGLHILQMSELLMHSHITKSPKMVLAEALTYKKLCSTCTESRSDGI